LKTGILITNLGTPQAPTKSAIKQYLAEFLADPYVVQMPKLLWWPLLNGIILQIRPQKSTRLYQKIWTSQGSPLLVFMSEILRKLRVSTKAKDSFHYALGMRYGQPSIQQALLDLRNQQASKLILFPLYPQYASTTTGSMFAEIEVQLKKMDWQPKRHFIAHYAEEPSHIQALVHTIRAHWQRQIPGQKLLFSFHGIPEKHITRGDPYYHQCLRTAQQIALKLNLDNRNWEIVFQSRFGLQRWLQPYCATRLKELPKTGCSHIDIICPGFSVDCLETLEEIAIRNKTLFHQAGGITYNYIPALNDSDLHIQSLVEILVKRLHYIGID
jgi:protoporphyrin/coproporphyrin ferrochelatase